MTFSRAGCMFPLAPLDPTSLVRVDRSIGCWGTTTARSFSICREYESSFAV